MKKISVKYIEQQIKQYTRHVITVSLLTPMMRFFLSLPTKWCRPAEGCLTTFHLGRKGLERGVPVQL